MNSLFYLSEYVTQSFCSERTDPVYNNETDPCGAVHMTIGGKGFSSGDMLSLILYACCRWWKL